jgi:MFS family permease
LGIILQGGLIGRLVRAFGEWPLVRISFITGAIGFAALGWTYGLPLLLVVAAVIAVSTGILRPALTSLITQVAAKTEQGSVLGCTQALQSVASIVAPFVAGLLIDAELLWLWAVLCAAGLVAGLFFPRPATVAAGRRPETEHVPVR